ncbi:MAG: RDD family protein [Rhodocyclaceae bacterium]|nr:RDD family protein [Rhodocyclaceae bacterium]MDZ4214728.1 RDD family protein [Rhodocyclaceae bacterium]
MHSPTTVFRPGLAGLRRRFASMLYESLLLLGVLSVSFMLPHLALGLAYEIVLPGPILVLHVFLVLGAYFVWYWHQHGHTLAMQTWKLKITRADGEKPSLNQLLLRYFLSWPSLLFYGAGLIWALVDRDRQFLHDRLAGTRIIFVPPTTTSTRPPAGK